MAQQGTSRSAPSPKKDVSPSIPDKLYFRIGEVAALCGVPTYVLRFWESEFPLLKPNKGGTGQRLYRRKDVEIALHIRKLLYEGKFTIPGARQAMRTELDQGQKAPQLSLAIVHTEHAEPRESSSIDRKALGRLQYELRELRDMLSSPPIAAPRRGAIQSIRGGRLASDLLSENLFQ